MESHCGWLHKCDCDFSHLFVSMNRQLKPPALLQSSLVFKRPQRSATYDTAKTEKLPSWVLVAPLVFIER